ncbi:M14 family metallopeptidase [Acetanaerobacterium elongatum]|uniref:Succinylglutamate desuccinylase/Aspartoacylase catalytic domain-containing protein n=1 Tax=Acetanaerobacterium elongatum TaxID=258515 RepID=A0A1G9TX10_9FIRM|nr:M14 family metallopeptidase [Acetanaerobacterium elongatum]SDM52279.1 hypothetical protein SAMN05192585_10110 [Acetanaerobacterium elongatum]
MLMNVVSVGLPVDEQLTIQKNRLQPVDNQKKCKRVCIVTGTHGDELDGQFICYELARRLSKVPQQLKGIVDIYPALNPLGLDSIHRGIPMFDLDMNRIFPGSENGSAVEYVAAKIIEDIAGADLCIDIHSSDIFLNELPQVRLSRENAPRLMPYARLLNTDLIWVYESSTVLEATLAQSLNAIGVPTLVAEIGAGMRINTEYGLRLTDGIVRLLHEIDILQGEVPAVCTPGLLSEGELCLVSAEASGVFVPAVCLGATVSKGEHLGDIVSPALGQLQQRVTAPCAGRIFTLREYPVAYKGTLLARIFKDTVPA